MKKNKHNKEQGPISWISVAFFTVVFCLAGVNFITPEKSFLAIENRPAAQFSKPAPAQLLSGEWSKKTDQAIQDQVFLREKWIDLQRLIGRTVFLSAEEEGILIGQDGWMFTKQFGLSNEKQLKKNLDAVREFARNSDRPVTILLAPSSSLVYEEMLPEDAPMLDEKTELTKIFSQLSEDAEVIDVTAVFDEKKGEEQLYYKTDHHWTTQGAYYAYREFCEQKHLQPSKWQGMEAVPEFYGTHYAKTRLWNAAGDTIFYDPDEHNMIVYDVLGEAQFSQRIQENLVNTKRFSGNDKYSAFLDGNNGYSVVEGNGTGSILIIKDSYANCFVPFLTANYERIGVVDYRNYAYGLESLADREKYDEILFLYSFHAFSEDSKIPWINRPSTLS